MKNIETGQAVSEELKNSKETLADMRKIDSRLRGELDGRFDDDALFNSLAEEFIKYMSDAANPSHTGIERARAFAAAEAVMKKMRETKRGALGGEFMEFSKKLEEVQEEVRELKALSK